MKASLLSVGLVFAALALVLVAADPVANETEVVVLDAVKARASSCKSFSMPLLAGSVLVASSSSCYSNSQFAYEGRYSVDTYTIWSYDSYSVHFGDQACGADPESFASFSYFSDDYSDHTAHSKSFG